MTMALRATFLLISLALTVPASAQQNIPAGDRVALQLGRLAIQLENQQDTITTLQQQLAAAQARVKEMEEKEKPAAPAAADPAKP